jgi:hypothetical protein
MMSTTTPAQSSTETCFTEVETLYIEGQLNFRLIFGHPAKVVENEFTYGQRTRETAYFRPGDIFAIDLWRKNEFGTTAWAVYVLQAAAPGETAYPVPQVKPAAKVLLEAVGVERARQALALLREIEERTDPTTLPANRYLLTDFRLKACQRTRNSRRA